VIEAIGLRNDDFLNQARRTFRADGHLETENYQLLRGSL